MIMNYNLPLDVNELNILRCHLTDHIYYLEQKVKTFKSFNYMEQAKSLEREIKRVTKLRDKIEKFSVELFPRSPS